MGRVEKRSALQLLLAQDKDRGAVAKVGQVLLIGHWVLSTLALNESEAGVELCFVRNLTSFKRTSCSFAYELHRGFYQKDVDANLASTRRLDCLAYNCKLAYFLWKCLADFDQVPSQLEQCVYRSFAVGFWLPDKACTILQQRQS